MEPTQQQLNNRITATGQAVAPTVSADTLMNPPRPLSIPKYEAPVAAPFVPSISTQMSAERVGDSLADVGNTITQLGQAPQRRQQLEAQAGIPALDKRLAELNSIDAQYGADLSNIASANLQGQVRAEDRQAPSFDIQGQQAQLNRNAIFEQQNVNIKRATNAAAIAAANGQLALAQDYVTRALDYEFKPLEAQLEFKKLIYQENKDIFSKAEQREFEAQIKADERDYEEKRAAKQQIQTYVQQAAANQAPADVIAEALSASDPDKALEVLSPYFRDPNADLQRELMRQQLVDARNKGAGAGMTTSQFFQYSNAIADDVRQDPDVKDFISVRDGYERVQTGANLDNAQGDLSLLFGYMKLLDPTSVVRETEFANAEQAMGYAQQVLNIPNKYLNGERLTPQARQDFVAAANKVYESKQGNYQNAIDYYTSRAQTFNIPPELVLRDFSAASLQSNPAPQAPQQTPFNESELDGISFSNGPSLPSSGFAQGIRKFFGL